MTVWIVRQGGFIWGVYDSEEKALKRRKEQEKIPSWTNDIISIDREQVQ